MEVDYMWLPFCNFRFGPLRAIPLWELHIGGCVQFFFFSLHACGVTVFLRTDIPGFVVITVKFELNLELASQFINFDFRRSRNQSLHSGNILGTFVDILCFKFIYFWIYHFW